MTYATWAKGCGCMTSAQTGTANGYTCPWHRDRHMALLGGYERQVAALREEHTRLRDATAPLVCINASHGDAHTLGCRCPCRVCQARALALLAGAEAVVERLKGMLP